MNKSYHSGGLIPNNTGEPIKLLDGHIDYISKEALQKYELSFLNQINSGVKPEIALNQSLRDVGNFVVKSILDKTIDICIEKTIKDLNIKND